MYRIISSTDSQFIGTMVDFDEINLTYIGIVFDSWLQVSENSVRVFNTNYQIDIELVD